MATIQLKSGGDLVATLKQFGHGDTLLLERGGRYEVPQGKLADIQDDDVTVGAFGDPGKPEPIVASRGDALFASGRRGLTIRDLRLEPGPLAAGTDPGTGLTLRNVRDAVVERVVITGHGQGMSVQGINGQRCSNVTARACRVFDNFDPADGKGQGVYASATDGLKLLGNLFVRNGWMPGRVRSNTLSHNAYVHQTCGPIDAAGNVFADASSHGLQARSGGAVRGNVFLGNPIHLSYGLMNGAGAPFPGGVVGDVDGNVFVGGRTIEASSTPRRGWGVELANTKRVRVTNNLAAHDQQGEPFFQLKPCRPDDVANAKLAIGILDLAFAGNLAWDWAGPVLAKQGVTAGVTGNRGIGRLVEQPSWAPPVQADLRAIVNLDVVRTLLMKVPGGATAAADLIARCRDAASPPPEDPQVALLRQQLAAVDAQITTTSLQLAALHDQRVTIKEKLAALGVLVP